MLYTVYSVAETAFLFHPKGHPIFKERESMKRYNYLDVARGIGMILVLIGHSAGLSKYFTCFFMQLFFVISGYIYKPGKTYKENVVHKTKRLLIPYFINSFVLLLFYVLMGNTINETKFSFLGILYSRFSLYDTCIVTPKDNIYFLNIANGAMWYLTAFFITGLIFHLVIDKCLESKKFLVACVCGLMIITMLLAETPILLPWSMDYAFVGTIFMIAGAFLHKNAYFEEKTKVAHVAIIAVLFFVTSTFNSGVNTSVREYGIFGKWSVPFYIVIGITGTMLCIWCAKLIQNTIMGKAFLHIGRNTIIILCYHILIFTIFEELAKRFTDVDALTGLLYVLYHTVRISAGILGCLILNLLKEKMIRLFHKS